jgi:hypothetical protein
VDEDWKDLIKRLKFHTITIESQTSSLEEDQSMDENSPPLDSGVEGPLREYIK